MIAKTPIVVEIDWRDLRPADFCRWIRRSNPTIVEVGANDGRDTRRFLETFARARVTVFEPDPRPLCRFFCNVPMGRVELVAAAVSDIDGEAPWFASGGRLPAGTKGDWAPEAAVDWDLSGSICQPTGHVANPAWVRFRERGTVQTIRLDTWLAQQPPDYRIDLLWADVQGAEALLIRGARETLRRTRFFYTEFSPEIPLYAGQPSRDELAALLPDWHLIGVFGNNLLLVNDAFQPAP